MAITITSREFNQHASRVLKMAEKEPVFITKWGKIVSVVSNYVDYQHNREMQEEPSFEQLFSHHRQDTVSDEFLADFDDMLAEIRRDSRHRAVELED